MKANPLLVPLHLQFQVVLSEGAVQLIPAHTHRERRGCGLSSVCLCVCLCMGLSHREVL